jgi:hypothetical protein
MAVVRFITDHMFWRLGDKSTFDGGFRKLHFVG